MRVPRGKYSVGFESLLTHVSTLGGSPPLTDENVHEMGEGGSQPVLQGV